MKIISSCAQRVFLLRWDGITRRTPYEFIMMTRIIFISIQERDDESSHTPLRTEKCMRRPRRNSHWYDGGDEDKKYKLMTSINKEVIQSRLQYESKSMTTFGKICDLLQDIDTHITSRPRQKWNFDNNVPSVPESGVHPCPNSLRNQFRIKKSNILNTLIWSNTT